MTDTKTPSVIFHQKDIDNNRISLADVRSKVIPAKLPPEDKDKFNPAPEMHDFAIGICPQDLNWRYLAKGLIYLITSGAWQSEMLIFSLNFTETKSFP